MMCRRRCRAALLVLFFGALAAVSPGQTAPAPAVTVTVTQRAPIEMISSSGDISGVKEAEVGSKFTLISSSGTQLTLADAQGARYLIAAGATDYQPPPPTAPVAPPPATTPAPVAQQAAPAPVAPAPVTPPPAAAPSPASAPAAPVAAAPSAADVLQVPIMVASNRAPVAVWPPGGMDGRPLLIAAHGHGGSGPGEIKGWLTQAQRHRFTVVCPTFLSAIISSNIPDDADYFRECLHWIDENLQFDHANVYMTGFSGGGFATWYLGTQRPDFIHGLFLQSGNFFGDYYGFDLSRWFDRPIEVIWGSRDLPDIETQGQQALDALKEADCKNVVHTVVMGAGHQEHRDMVVTWMEQSVAAAAAAPN